MWFILLLILSIALLHQYVKRHYSYWQREGLIEEPGEIPFGMLTAVMQRKRSFGLLLSDIYERHSANIVGIYMFYRRSLLVRDPQLARQILTSDFGSFHDRGVYVDEQHDQLSANLFNLRGASWRNLRAKLTPSFSSGKIKGMFATIDDVGDKLVQHLCQELDEQPQAEIEMKEMLTTYAVDIIGSVIFGLDIDSFSNPNNEFRAVSASLFKQEAFTLKIHNMASFICPPIAKLMNRFGFKNEILIALRNIMQHTIEFRERHNVVRKDLLQLLIRLRNTGKIGDDDDKIWDIETAQEQLKDMPIDKIAAQAFLFYVAGSETTAAAAAFTLYELAMYPEYLQQARQEVDAVLQQHNLQRNDKLTYEAVQQMKYLDNCIMETIRKYPGLLFLNRECTADYTLPDGSYTIKKGTPILISLLAMHRDEQHFPNPNGYEPHRFDANVMNYNPTAYMPFGEGPRHCIAERMGRVNAKVAVAKILANFDIAQEPRKEVEFRFDEAPVLVPKDGLKLRLSKRV